MSNPERKVKSILAYLVPSLISNILPFITFPIITRFLSPEDFGIAALVTSSTVIIINFFACNIDAATQRYYFQYRKSPKDLGELINTSLLFLLIVIAITIPLIYFFSNFISKVVMGSSRYWFAVFIAYVANCFSIIVNFYLSLYRNMERSKDFSFFTTVQMLINTVLAVVFIVAFKLGYMGLIYAVLCSTFVIFLILFRRFSVDFAFCFNTKMLIDNLKYGIPLLLNLFTSSIYQFFDKYMLRTIVSLTSTGIFSIAQNISSKFFVFMTAVQATFDPIFMKDMFDNPKTGAVSVGRNFTIFTYISLGPLIVASLFAEEIIHLLAPPNYYNAINVFLILLGGIATQTFGKIVGSQLAYAKKAYLSFPITVVGVIVNVSLNLLLIPKWEASGAAFATMVTILMMNYIFIRVSQKYYKIIYEKKVMFLIYFNVYLSIFLMIYLKSYEPAFLIKYALKIILLLLYVTIGNRSNILTKKKMNMVLRSLTFKKTSEKILEL